MVLYEEEEELGRCYSSTFCHSMKAWALYVVRILSRNRWKYYDSDNFDTYKFTYNEIPISLKVNMEESYISFNTNTENISYHKRCYLVISKKLKIKLGWKVGFR